MEDTSASEKPRTISIDAAVKKIGGGMSRASGYRAARRGELPVIRFGRRILVLADALDRMLGEHPAPAEERHA
jgi:hypothetical protein